MSTNLAPDVWTTLAGVFRLDGNAFVHGLHLGSRGVLVALAIVLGAGLSQAIANSIVLFANRVQPARFYMSLGITAVLFAFNYGFLVLSTWLVMRLPGAPDVGLATLALIFALAYAPLLFSFLGALPYLGNPILWGLRIWQLLALVVGLSAVAHVGALQAGGYVLLGWIALAVSEQTFGRPLAQMGTRVMDAVAGVSLVSDEQVAIAQAQDGQDRPGALASAPVTMGGGEPRPPSRWKNWIALGSILVFALFLSVILAPVRHAAFGWENNLPRVLRLPLDLIWIGIIAVVVAGFLAPLETLGWWAGWYGDDISLRGETEQSSGGDAGKGARTGKIKHYVVYLDGIAQSSSQYTPDIETFLDALTPRLPSRFRLVRGVMAYSVMNKPLDSDPTFSWLWSMVEKLRFKNANSIFGMLINLRNVLIVAVSADRRYGPMYNFGIAQVMCDALIAAGYARGSGLPITLIGYSGGGQMSCGSARFLKRALDAPVDVISLGGVISGSDDVLALEHLYHLHGTKDGVERIGPIMFPSRWKIAVLSYWNRAKRLGRLSVISLGPVGHQVPGGLLDPNATLPDGRTNLAQTLDYIHQILLGRLVTDTGIPEKPSNYDGYVQAPSNRPDYYPLDKVPDARRYAAVGDWIGRLILPSLEERAAVRGAWLEVHHAPDGHANLVGHVVKLRWGEDPVIRDIVRAVTRDVHFSAEASFASTYGGTVNPTRLNNWRMVDPLESLAGAHPVDDVVVTLAGPVRVVSDAEDGDARGVSLEIIRQPVQVTGRYYGLVRFVGPVPDTDRIRAVHYEKSVRDFTGPEEELRFPEVVADLGGRKPSNVHGIERSPLNDDGWYVYGAPGPDGAFVVQALAPRALLRTTTRRAGTFDESAGREYVRKKLWEEVAAHAGGCVVAGIAERQAWAPDDVGLLVHSYGGIGGRNGEAAAQGRFYFGHFAYGIAQVVEDPIAGEPRFDVVYYQVYAQNTDGFVAGALHWSRYMGDRQFGWAGLRAVADVVLSHESFDESVSIGGKHRASPLVAFALQLEAMTARYRIGEGTGATFVGPANNCSQDSNRALFAALGNLESFVESNPAFETWAQDSPEDGARWAAFRELSHALKRDLQPFGAIRHDWSDNEYNLGTTMEDAPLANVAAALGSWRCIFPRVAFDTIVGTFLRHGASAHVLGSNQIPVAQDGIEARIPFAF